MTNMITRCPACETSFRITEAQLNTAKGAVRCGSCLQIFRAADHLVPPRTERGKAHSAPGQMPKAGFGSTTFEYKKPADSPQPPAAKKPISETPTGSDQPPASATNPANKKAASDSTEWQYGDEDEWQYGSGGGGFAEGAGQENMLRFDQTAIDAEDDSLEPGIANDDMLISDEMLLSDDGELPSKSAYGDELSESILDLDSWKPAAKSLFDREEKPRQDDEENQQYPDESWAIDLLEDDDEPVSFAPPPAGRTSPPMYDPAPTRDPLDDLEMEEPDDRDDGAYLSYSRTTTGSFSAPDEADPSLSEPLTEKKIEHKARPAFDEQDSAHPEEDYRDAFDDYLGDEDEYADDSDRSELISRIEPAPVEFAFYQERPWRKRLLWGGMVTLGLLLLAGQIAWLQFNTLSRQQPYRDIYASLCPLFGCELPTLAAPEMIRTSNLVVRSHPQAEGALMVDTILLNTASFQQPFPDLVLSFSNIHGETLAARRFTPREYLAGELAGRTSMPSNQPVHLSLEVVDPGPDAVSYSAYIPH